MRKWFYIWGALNIILLLLVCTLVRDNKRLNTDNVYLKKRLAYLEPQVPRKIMPPSYRGWKYPVSKILSQGQSLAYRTLELNRNWQRPLYIPQWHSTSWQSERFAYVPRLVEYNRHRVFVYPGGGSYWFDLAYDMGFTDDTCPVGVSLKSQTEVAVIALEASITDIRKLEDEMVVVIRPQEKGYHIVALEQESFLGNRLKVVTSEGCPLEQIVMSHSKGSNQ